MNDIEDFWELNSPDVWLIKRKGMVDMWLFIDTMKYIYKSSVSEIWYGTKDPTPLIRITTEKIKRKEFKSETDAVKWLQK